MNYSKLITVFVAPLCFWSAAMAQDTGGPYPLDPEIPKPVLSRAEVIADLQIWRESGAARLVTENEGGTDFNDPSVQAAEARYRAMRESPRFALLVAQIAKQHNVIPQVASTR